MTRILRAPVVITPAYLEVLVMPNGEVICNGTTVGTVGPLGPYLRPREGA